MLGSYVDVHGPYYQTYYPDTPYHAGSSGWKTAPVPGWGENSRLAGPRRLALGIDWQGDVLPSVISGVISATIVALLIRRK